MNYIRLVVLCLWLLLISTCAICQSGCVIAENNTEIRFEKGNLISEESIKIIVLNQDFDWISDFSIPFQKGDKLDILEAYILDKSGKKVRTLKNSDIVTSSLISSGTFHSDMYKKSFGLHWGDYPFTIYLKYRSVTDQYISFADWTPYYHFNIPVRSANLSIEVPEDFKISIYQRGDVKYTKSKTKESVIHSWSTGNLPAIYREYFLPPVSDVLPIVMVNPEKFFYSKEGELTSWQSFGIWIDGLISGMDELTPAEKVRVQEIVDGTKDKREIIRRLYHYMQDNTHYINVSLKDGGYKPYPATYVCNNKYGDCKALTIYMKALLKEADIESYFSVIDAGDDPETTIMELPGPQFNHVILCVPMENDTIWLENTNRFSPAGYLGCFTQDRPSLVVNGSESRLVMTPPLDSSDLTDVSSYIFNLDREGNGTVTGLKQFSGNSFDSFIHYRNLLSEERITDAILVTIPFNVDKLTEWSFDGHDRDDSHLSLRLKAEISNHYRNLGNYTIISLPSDVLPQMESPETRVMPARIFSPIMSIDTLTYCLGTIEESKISLPEDINLESRFGKYTVRFTLSDNKAVITRQIILYKGEYTDDEYKAFYEYMTSIRNSLKKAHIIIN